MDAKMEVGAGWMESTAKERSIHASTDSDCQQDPMILVDQYAICQKMMRSRLF